MATVLLGVTGSIAAYKACELTRLLVKAGNDVHVVMTQAAMRFVSPLTFRTLSRNPVPTDSFAEPETWMPGHISLAERADILIIAPCTANVIAKLAYGLADDLLTATALASRAPLVIAPAMNSGMWEHPATQANLGLLASRGVRLADAGTGDLACGTQGKGRMAEPQVIFDLVSATLQSEALNS
ncbi:MAG TPA: flavoprotein [Kiritimatiellia bacterium]|mgnify:FL=1|jgi:phosphopantothenoylcysteine decarboxylase/phosphopantothenate--cysteine ligase|nr:flavoprotein [Kiritimatiellia bacterium]